MENSNRVATECMRFLSHCAKEHPLLKERVKVVQHNFRERYGKEYPSYNAALAVSKTWYPQLFNSLMCQMTLIAGRQIGPLIKY